MNTIELQKDINALQDNIDSMLSISSNGVSATDIKNAYAEKLHEKGDSDKASHIISLEGMEPIFAPNMIYGEQEPILKQINEIPADAAIDIATIDNEITNAASKYANLISNTISRMNLVEQKILAERQRIDDINRICSSFKQFTNIKTLKGSDMSGSFTYDANNTFSAFSPVELEGVALSVVNVDGNGYAGNRYVSLRNGSFAAASLDTSNTDFLIDNSVLTSFEYSRLCGTEKRYLNDVNIDNENAVCSIELSTGQNKVNAIKIDTDSTDLTVKDVLVSNDNGCTYYSAFTKTIKLGASMYSNYNYVCGSNIICFPKTNFFKIVFESGMIYDGEMLAYRIVNSNNADEITYETTQMQGVKRKVISVGGITAYFAQYTESTLLSGQLVDTGKEYKSIGIFANQYIPDYFKNKQYIKYTLTVNGEDYADIKPVNSNDSGIKIISSSDYQYSNSNIAYLTSPIKSAQLKVEISIPDQNSTPYLANLKVCLGE